MLKTVRFLAFATVLLLLVGAAPSRAATPSSGTISTLTPNLAYSSGPFAVANPTPTPLLDSEPTCDAAHMCDHYTLTVSLPADYQTNNPSQRVIISASPAIHEFIVLFIRSPEKARTRHSVSSRSLDDLAHGRDHLLHPH